MSDWRPDVPDAMRWRDHVAGWVARRLGFQLFGEIDFRADDSRSIRGRRGAMTRRDSGNALSAHIERMLAAAREGSLPEAEAALDEIRLKGRTGDHSVLEMVERIRSLRRTLDNPRQLERYAGGPQFARVHLLADVQGLRRRLIELLRQEDEHA